MCAAVIITLCPIKCICPKTSDSPCCKLAQVVALSSPPSNVKLSVWLPSSCNAKTLIAKVTTQLKEVVFCQHIRRYQILCCYRVSRPGLLKVQWLRELVRVDRVDLVAMSNCRLTFQTTELWDSTPHWESKSNRKMKFLLFKKILMMFGTERYCSYWLLAI